MPVNATWYKTFFLNDNLTIGSSVCIVCFLVVGFSFSIGQSRVQLPTEKRHSKEI